MICLISCKRWQSAWRGLSASSILTAATASSPTPTTGCAKASKRTSWRTGSHSTCPRIAPRGWPDCSAPLSGTRPSKKPRHTDATGRCDGVRASRHPRTSLPGSLSASAPCATIAARGGARSTLSRWSRRTAQTMARKRFKSPLRMPRPTSGQRSANCGRDFGLTRERIRQRQARALRRLRELPEAGALADYVSSPDAGRPYEAR